MCKLIAELLGADKHILGGVLDRLEGHCGNPGIDVRLTGEIYGRIHMKMRELGLDPNDTTPHELYQSLISLAALHDSFLAKRLGIVNKDDPAEISKAIVRLVNHLKIPIHSWSLRPTAIRQLLKNTPPKVLMKQLNYRSLDSMLKREVPCMLLAAARHSEPPQWQNKFVHTYKKLQPNDFEVRDIEVIYADGERWSDLGINFSEHRRSNILLTPEAGAVVLLPIQVKRPAGLTLTSLLMTLHHINEIRAFSTYCKFHHMRSDFGGLLVEHILHEKQSHVKIASQAINWRVVHRYFGSVTRVDHPEIFEPHVQPEDLSYHKAESILFRLEPALSFWHDTDYLGLPQPSGPVSFNLTDMALNLVNNLNYENKAYYHMQASLWNEIHNRYISQRTFENQIISQLDESNVFSMIDSKYQGQYD